MNLDLRYLGRSETRPFPGGMALAFAPNLARPKVFFDGELGHPLRFREAVSALHDVVVGDLRIKKKDKSAYEQWKQDQARQEAELRRVMMDQARRAEIAKIVHEPIPDGLDLDFRRMHDLYWRARRQWAGELSRNDPELFRHLVPCDPVVTVAPDIVFFECFSKDESSYGCLQVDRNAFSGATDSALGTTNVDYSLALYDHFQTLRTYRPTRLLVDPTGFEVQVESRDDYREEKIDLPPSWLRGFGQIQAAMGLPCRRVELSVEALYSILAYLKRHREKTGPRSIRFGLTPGQAPTLTLDPWGVAIGSRGPVYDGQRAEEIKVWGRRRLMIFARVLPLIESVEVALLGSGLPSIWIAHMGEMRLILALSGWTTNDWTSSAALDLMAAAYPVDPEVTLRASRHLEESQQATLASVQHATGASRETALGSLHRLAKQGQVIYDFAGSCYRWRQVMPVALSESVIGPEPPELTHGRRIHAERKVRIEREEALPGGRRMIAAQAEKTQCEGILDGDGVYSKAKCSCSYFYKNRLRGGPCRHLLAVQLLVKGAEAEPPPVSISTRGH
jgi:hypothetical protein